MAISRSTDRFNGYVASLAIKPPCVVATAAEITLEGTQTVNGVAVVSGDRVLVKDQTNLVENGIYEVRSTEWERTPDFDGNRDVTENSVVIVGVAGGSPVMYRVTGTTPFRPGTDQISFEFYFDPDNPAAATLQQVTDVGNQTTASLFIGEKAAREVDRPGFGQLWVRDDVPNVLVFADENGTEIVLGESNVNDGTVDGQMLYWDQTGTQKYLATSNMAWNDTTRFMRIRVDEDYATPPGGGTPAGGLQIYDNQGDDILALIGYDNANVLLLRSYIHGAGILIRGEDSSGNVRTIADLSPNGNQTFYYQGSIKFLINASGIQARGSLNNNPTTGGNQTAQILLENFGGSDIAQLGFAASQNLYLNNYVHGGSIVIEGETSAGATTQFINLDPDSDAIISAPSGRSILLRSGTTTAIDLDGVDVRISGGGVELLRSSSRASGSINIYNDKTHGSTGVLSRVLTQSDIEAGQFRLLYAWTNSLTATDPGQGRFKFNNSDYSLATELYINDDSDSLINSDRVLTRLAQGDRLYICETTDNAQSVVFEISGAPTDNTGWWTIPITYVDGVTTGLSTSSNEECVIEPFFLSAVSAVPNGTADGQLLLWDQTTDQAWEASSAITIDDAGEVIRGTNLHLDFNSTTNRWALKRNDGSTLIAEWSTTDGGTIQWYDIMRLESGNYMEIFGTGGGRARIRTDTDNRLWFTQDNGVVGAKFDYQIYLHNAGGPAASGVSGKIGLEGIYAALHTRNPGTVPSEFFCPVQNVNSRVWRFNNPTAAADPGSQFMRANTNDLTTITAFYMDDLDVANQDTGIWWARIAVGDILYVSQLDQYQFHWGYYEITSITDNTGWWTVGVSHIDSGDSGAGSVYTNGVAVYIDHIPQSRMTGITGTLPDGTVSRSTIYWDGAAWTENTFVKLNDIGSGTSAQLSIDASTANNSLAESAIYMPDINNGDFYILGVNNPGDTDHFAIRWRKDLTTANERVEFEWNDYSGGSLWMQAWRNYLSSGEGMVGFNNADIRLQGPSVFMGEQAAALADIAGFGQLWVKNDVPNTLWFTDDAGTDYQLSGTFNTLSGLTDTNITTPSNGQILMWDSTPGEWINTTTLPAAMEFTNLVDFSGDATGLSLRVTQDALFFDNAAVGFGTGSGTIADVRIYWDATDLKITGGASNQTINFQDGHHIRLWDSTDTSWFDMHLTSTTLDITESGLTSVEWPAAGTLILDMNDNQIDKPILKDYAIESNTPTFSANAATFAYANGPAFNIDIETATGNVTFTLSGGPPSGDYGQITIRVVQDGDAARTITWAGGTFVWAGGVAHTLNSTLNGVSIYTFETWDGGTTWHGAGADYS